MARHRGDGASHTYPDDDYYPVHPDSERRHRRRHRHRDHDTHDTHDAYPPQPDSYDLDALRPRDASYYADSDPYRDRERMAQPSRSESTRSKPRTSRELHRDGTRRKKKRDPVPERRSDEYAYTRSQPRALVEEVTVRTSSGRKRSDEGASSSRTAYTPLSGSGTASVRRLDATSLSRSASAREPSRSYMATRPVRRISTTKLSAPAQPTVSRSFSAREPPRRNTGGLLSSFFRPSLRTPPTAVPRYVSPPHKNELH
jgi:hypothetical protein